MLIEGFEHLNVYLILVQEFPYFFVSLNRAVKKYPLDNFLLFLISMLFGGCKCLNVYLKLVQKFSNFFSSLYRAFRIFE